MAPAHVLVFPWPMQGHINCMLHFATGLAGAGLHVSFLHTEHNLRLLGLASAAAAPRLRFLSVPDGLPDDHPRSVGDLIELARSLKTEGSVAYRALLTTLLPVPPAESPGGPSSDAGVDPGFPPVTCVVADGLLPWAIDTAEELGVPALAFRTASACSFLAYLSVPKLFDLGEVPFPAGGSLDEPVRGVPRMESYLRRRDLPRQCRRLSETVDVDPMLHLLATGTAHNVNARALILNTAASLEGSAVTNIARRTRDVFAIGPLHAASPAAPAVASSLWREDDGCTAWLDGHADRSVVFVSLGSLAVISHEQFTEFLCGLIAAGYPFLWVLRPDMVDAGGQDAALLREAIRAVGGTSAARVVPWAPQRDVLRHRAVGCFLTHAGWNSTLEGIVEGVPMVCWPFFADQQTNSRFVGAVWGNGLDMKDVCDRAVVQRTLKEAMESDVIKGAAQALAQQVRRDVDGGGSSAVELQRLVAFIEELSAQPSHYR